MHLKRRLAPIPLDQPRRGQKYLIWTTHVEQIDLLKDHDPDPHRPCISPHQWLSQAVGPRTRPASTGARLTATAPDQISHVPGADDRGRAGGSPVWTPSRPHTPATRPIWRSTGVQTGHPRAPRRKPPNLAWPGTTRPPESTAARS